LLSVGDDGGSFQLYIVGYRMRFQIFSSKDGTWDVVREPSVPEHQPILSTGSSLWTPTWQRRR
jgi:hypothetical protein